jgi:hypothetical protein
MGQRKIPLTAALIVAAFALLQATSGIPAAHAANNTCRKACKQVFKGCKAQAGEHYRAARDDCRLLPTKGDRRQCRREARIARRDARRACRQRRREIVPRCQNELPPEIQIQCSPEGGFTDPPEASLF